MKVRELHSRALRMVAACAAAWLVCVPQGARSQGAAPAPDFTPSTPLPWAYPLGPGAAPPKDDGPKRLPGSAAAFTVPQVRDAFNVADWQPGDHPAMPPIVVNGRRPDVRGCGYCHMPNGAGRPENSSVSGLPVSYFMQQMADWKSGQRKSSEPKMGPPAAMLAIAKAATEEEARVAAEYFASIPPKKWIRVVESANVPKTRVSGGMMVPAEGGGTEPLGQRIIEMPEDLERTELRDPRSGFVAYVPVGSIEKGAELAKTGGATVSGGQLIPGRTVQCSICHGDGLRGLGPVPRLAGRSPSYLVRQLYDMQIGNRRGLGAELMKAAVANLTTDDLIALAAYTASLAP